MPTASLEDQAPRLGQAGLWLILDSDAYQQMEDLCLSNKTNKNFFQVSGSPSHAAVAGGTYAGLDFLLGFLAPHLPLLGRGSVLILSKPEVQELPLSTVTVLGTDLGQF